MADELDLCNAIADALTPVLTPLFGTAFVLPEPIDRGRYHTQTVPTVNIGVGHPLLRTLTERLEAEKADLFVMADEKLVHVDQYQRGAFFIDAPIPPLLTTSVSGTACTLGGALQKGDTIGVQVGSVGAGYGVTGLEGSVAIVARNFEANCLAAGLAAVLSGDTVTVTPIPTTTTVAFIVGSSSTGKFEAWRRRKVFFGDLYTADPFSRQYLGGYIEALYYGSMGGNNRIPTKDGTGATVLACDYIDMPDQQRDGAYLRRTRWLIDYTAIVQAVATEVVAGTIDTTAYPATQPMPPLTPLLASQL